MHSLFVIASEVSMQQKNHYSIGNFNAWVSTKASFPECKCETSKHKKNVSHVRKKMHFEINSEFS